MHSPHAHGQQVSGVALHNTPLPCSVAVHFLWPWLCPYLFIDAGIPTVLLCCASQHHSLQVWNDVELAIVVVVMLNPWGLYPDNLTPARQQ